MNEQRFDDMFRDRLADYSNEPTSESFKKLNSKLAARKRQAVLQFAKLAATLLIIAISVYVIGQWNNEPDSSHLTQEIAPDANKETIQKYHVVKPAQDQPETPDENLQTTAPNSEVDNKEEEIFITKVPAEPLVAQANDKNDNPPEKPIRDQSEISSDSVYTATSARPKRHKVTITYKRSPAPPEPMLALQTKPKENNKVLSKIVARAQSLQLNEFSLAGIRSAKDELLSIDRKDRKTSKSN